MRGPDSIDVFVLQLALSTESEADEEPEAVGGLEAER